ncbi:MAG TPA: iron-sulfur cluster assembly protein [Pseudonocardia sp.]
MTSTPTAREDAAHPETDPDTLELVEGALRKVYDPCSVAAGTTMNILDMGLVRDWTLEEGRLEIEFCVTSVSCRLAPSFIRAAENELLGLPGIQEVKSTIDAAFIWTEDRLSASARARLEETRTALRLSVRPQQWKTDSARASGVAGRDATHAPRS